MKKPCSFSLLFFFSLLSANLFAQNKQIDSLFNVLKVSKEDTNKVKALNNLGLQFRNISNYEEAKRYSAAALLLAGQLDYQKGKAKAYNNLGLIESDKGNYEEALKNHLADLKIEEEINDKQNIGHSYSNIGIIYLNQGNYSEALNNYLKALKIALELGDQIGITSSYNNLGNYYTLQGNYTEALKNFLASLKINEKLGDQRGIAGCFNNIGVIYEHQENYPDALKNYLAALKINEEIGNKDWATNNLNNIGAVYDIQGNDSEALKMYDKALKLEKEIGDIAGCAYSYLNIGAIYLKQEKYPETRENLLASLALFEEIGMKDGIAMCYANLGGLNILLADFLEAKKYLVSALSLSREIGNKKIIMETYNSLSQLDSAQGNFSQALENFKLHALYKDSIFNEETGMQTEQLKIQYETATKDKQLQLLTAERELQSAEVSRQKTIRNMSIVIFALLVVTGTLGFNRFRQTQAKKRTAERARISRDLHDEIGSGISKIALLSEVVRQNPDDPQSKANIEKITSSANEALEHMGEIVWSMNPKNDLLENLVAYTRKYAMEYFEPTGIECKVNMPEVIQHITVSGEHRRNIFLCVKEALHNVVKHSGARRVELSFISHDHRMEITIHDDGKGINPHAATDFGNGLGNMEQRMKAMGGQFSIENNSGTTVRLSMNLT